jgi:hypothetical protein
MTSEKNVSDVVPLIRSLLPNASGQELEEAQQALTEYVATVLRIFDRIEQERQDDSRDHMNDSRIEVV